MGPFCISFRFIRQRDIFVRRMESFHLKMIPDQLNGMHVEARHQLDGHVKAQVVLEGAVQLDNARMVEIDEELLEDIW